MKNFDCVSIGDAVMDVYLTLHEATVNCKKNDEECVICLPYGEKIPVDRLDRGLGGIAMNNAVGLSRLGFKTALFSVHGDDEIGEQIDDMLDKEGVNRSLVVSQAGTQSRYSTIINFKNERTILEYSLPHHYHLPHEFPPTSWIYVSSVGDHYEEFLGALAAHVKEKGINLAFTPTNAQLNSPLETYLPLIAESKIIFMNVTEAKRMVHSEATVDNGQWIKNWKKGNGDRGEIKNMLAGIYDLGAEIVVITDGRKGSYAYDGGSFYYLGILDGPVVSATGAGDAYASGFMGAMMRGLSMTEAMRWGSINAGAVVTKYGPQTGLLSEGEIKKVLGENPDFTPEKI